MPVGKKLLVCPLTVVEATDADHLLGKADAKNVLLPQHQEEGFNGPCIELNVM